MNTIHTAFSNEQILDRCKCLLEEMEHLLLGVEPMSPDEVRQTPKMPGHAEDLVGEVALQCEAVNVVNAGEDTTVADMREDLVRARALREVLWRHELVHARLRAWRLRMDSRTWRSALAFYSVLRRRARHDAGLRDALEPVASFFRAGREGRRRFGRGMRN